MNDGDLAEALLGLQDATVEVLRGKGTFVLPPRSVALASVVVDSMGRWRPPHPVVHARELLRDVLSAFERAGSGDAAQRTEVAEVVGLTWGVTGHPLSVGRAQLRLGMTARRTAERWEFKVASDHAVSDLLAHHMARQPTRHSFPASSVPECEGFSSGPAPDLLQRLSANLRAHGNQFPVEMPADLRQRLLTQAALDCVVDAVRRWYGKGQPCECSGHLRFFDESMTGVWDRFCDGPSDAAPSPGTRKPSGRVYERAVRAAVTVCLHDVARPGSLPGILKRLDELIRLRKAPMISRAWPLLAGPAESALQNAAGKFRALVVVNQGAHLPANGTRGPQLLAALAKSISSLLGSGPEIAADLVREYLRKRPAVLEQPLSREDEVVVALADHDVHWDTVVLEDGALEAKVRAARRGQPVSAKAAYLALTWRAPALLLNKQNRWPEASSRALAGLDEVIQWKEDGTVKTWADLLATAEQLWLALAGVNLRQVEWFLTRSATAVSGLGVARACRVALFASGNAVRSIEALDGTDILGRVHGDGLPTERHSEGRIDSAGWWARVVIVRLRVLLAVRTALGAGLTDDRTVFADATTTAHDPLKSFAPTSQDREMLGLDNIRELYKALLRLSCLSTAHHPEIASLALWLALLDDGVVPLEPAASTALRPGLAFLLGEGGEAPAWCRPLDTDQLVGWLSTGGTDGSLAPLDAGVLSWIPSKYAAARYLNRTSGGKYESFRVAHDTLRPAQPSHD